MPTPSADRGIDLTSISVAGYERVCTGSSWHAQRSYTPESDRGVSPAWTVGPAADRVTFSEDIPADRS